MLVNLDLRVSKSHKFDVIRPIIKVEFPKDLNFNPFLKLPGS